jgi:hypothetical protein
MREIFLRQHRPTLAMLSLFLFSFIHFGITVGQNVANARPSAGYEERFIVTGELLDAQGQPVSTAVISLGDHETESQENGSWLLSLPEIPAAETTIRITRPHFSPVEFPIGAASLAQLAQTGQFHAGSVTLEREISAGFWVASLVFVLVLLLIALEKLHSTTAALVGLSLLFLSTFIGRAFAPGWFIYDFEQALHYINWEVIFLVMGMMIVIAIIEETGIFQWTAFQAYRLSGGRLWLLVLILMLVTAVASALLDNFTTMLLMTPISLQIGIALGINPLALIIPEVLASNVGGISTLIGTPTNILIGAHAGIGFTDFLVNQTAGVLVALGLMGGFVVYHYRQRTVSG